MALWQGGTARVSQCQQQRGGLGETEEAGEVDFLRTCGMMAQVR